jgi:hypothetical protein
MLSVVVESARPIIGALKESYWDRELLSRIGGSGCHLTAFAVPLICRGRVIYILYGDNYPGIKAIEGVDELITFAHLAGIILEKTRLQIQT